jgi:hypothetical protein
LSGVRNQYDLPNFTLVDLSHIETVVPACGGSIPKQKKCRSKTGIPKHFLAFDPSQVCSRQNWLLAFVIFTRQMLNYCVKWALSVLSVILLSKRARHIWELVKVLMMQKAAREFAVLKAVGGVPRRHYTAKKSSDGKILQMVDNTCS